LTCNFFTIFLMMTPKNRRRPTGRKIRRLELPSFNWVDIEKWEIEGQFHQTNLVLNANQITFSVLGNVGITQYLSTPLSMLFFKKQILLLLILTAYLKSENRVLCCFVQFPVRLVFSTFAKKIDKLGLLLHKTWRWCQIFHPLKYTICQK